MNNDTGYQVQNVPGNIVLRVLAMIGTAFLVVAGGYIPGARADNNSGRSGERGHTAAQERSHYGPAEERNRTGARGERERIDTVEARHHAESAGAREHTGAGSRNRVP